MGFLVMIFNYMSVYWGKYSVLPADRNDSFIHVYWTDWRYKPDRLE